MGKRHCQNKFLFAGNDTGTFFSFLLSAAPPKGTIINGKGGECGFIYFSPLLHPFLSHSPLFPPFPPAKTGGKETCVFFFFLINLPPFSQHPPPHPPHTRKEVGIGGFFRFPFLHGSHFPPSQSPPFYKNGAHHRAGKTIPASRPPCSWGTGGRNEGQESPPR